MKRFFEKLYRKYFRDPPPVSLPRTLRRKGVYILPTRYGLLFILILAGMLLGSVNHNNNLGFMLTFLLSGMLFISMMHTYRNMIGIEIVSATVEPVYAEDDAVFEFLIRTGNLRRAAVSTGFSNGEEKLQDFEPDTPNRVRVVSKPTRRGVFRPGPLLISTRYPFGLFYSWSRLHLDLECLIYPKPIPSTLEPAHNRSDGDGEGKQDVSGVDDFLGLKPYQPGDSLQHVSWKAFSRGQGLFTKMFTGLMGSSVMLDWYGFKEADTERKLSMLCDMVLKADRMNVDFGLNLPGKTIEPDRGEAHKRNCLKTLALFGLSSENR
jgi:uncharacterized protein (DUF58 family)